MTNTVKILAKAVANAVDVANSGCQEFVVEVGIFFISMWGTGNTITDLSRDSLGVSDRPGFHHLEIPSNRLGGFSIVQLARVLTLPE
jgi:hypothetical protein